MTTKWEAAGQISLMTSSALRADELMRCIPSAVLSLSSCRGW